MYRLDTKKIESNASGVNNAM